SCSLAAPSAEANNEFDALLDKETSLQSPSRKSREHVIYQLRIAAFPVVAQLVIKDRCGWNHGNFKIGVDISASSLDDHGFIVNNLDFIAQTRFEFRQAPLKSSCEELGAGVALIAVKMIPSLLSVRVAVQNNLGSTVTIWNRGSELPKFPRRATAEEIAEPEPYRGCGVRAEEEIV